MATEKYPATRTGYFSTNTSLLSPPTVHHVVPRCLVAATEAFAVVCPGAFGNMRMTILITIVDVGSAVVVVVLAGTFDTVVISLPLNVAKFLWRHVPVVVAVAIVVLVLECRGWRCERLSHCKAGR